jgi:hypothetical protein
MPNVFKIPDALEAKHHGCGIFDDDADDLACWLESPDLDGQNTIIQTASVRGADAVTEAGED